MELMLLFLVPADTATPETDEMAEMSRFVDGIIRQGKLRRGAPLAAERTMVRVRDGEAFVTDGPFAESKEMVAGFWVVDVASRDEAIDIAARTPHARGNAVEVHRTAWRRVYEDSGRGTPFLFAFHVEPGPRDPDGTRMERMIAFTDDLARDGRIIETAPLASDPPAARIEVRRGRPLVTDGPFAESKEMIGGYALVRAADRAAAIAIAKRYPHAQWGSIEVREILFFDRV